VAGSASPPEILYHAYRWRKGLCITPKREVTVEDEPADQGFGPQFFGIKLEDKKRSSLQAWRRHAKSSSRDSCVIYKKTSAVCLKGWRFQQWHRKVVCLPAEVTTHIMTCAIRVVNIHLAHLDDVTVQSSELLEVRSKAAARLQCRHILHTVVRISPNFRTSINRLRVSAHDQLLKRATKWPL
jgi:hypothetical protein